MGRAALVVRLALAALAVGAAACKKEAEPAKPASSESARGGGQASAEGTKRNPQLPAMPRKRPEVELPDRAGMRAMRDERRKQVLDTYDADKNGELDDAERQVMHEARVADMVARMDQNADGKLTREELDASTSHRRRPPPDFESIDTNKDGFVTVEELAAARSPRQFRDRRDEPPPPPTQP